MNAKEKWILETENSLNGIQRAETDPFFYTRLKQRIAAAQQDYAPVKMVWLVSASLLLVFLLNFFALRFANSRPLHDAGTLNELSGQLQLMNTNSIDYN
jgi:hypothetical protein